MHAGARLAIFFFLRMESMQWCVCGVVEHHDVKEKAKIFVRCDLSHVSYLFPCFSGFPPQFCHIFLVFLTCCVCKTHPGFYLIWAGPIIIWASPAPARRAISRGPTSTAPTPRRPEPR